MEYLGKFVESSKEDLKAAKLIIVVIPMIIALFFYGVYKISLTDFIQGKSINNEITILLIATKKISDKSFKYGSDVINGLNNKYAIVNYRLIDDDVLDIDYNTFSISNYFKGQIFFSYNEDNPTEYEIKSTNITGGENCIEYIEGLRLLKFSKIVFNGLDSYTFDELKDTPVFHNGETRYIPNQEIKTVCNSYRVVDVDVFKSII